MGKGWPLKFTTGSPALHVAAVQGPPNRIYGDTWYYGRDSYNQSKVSFRNNRVYEYERKKDPLHVQLLVEKSPLSPGAKILAEADRVCYAINTTYDAVKEDELYELAANSNNPAGCINWGHNLFSSKKIRDSGRWKQLDEWYQRASLNANSLANQYDLDGMFAMGCMLRFGRPASVDMNVPAAHEWWREAASLGHVPSMCCLAWDLLDDENANEIDIQIDQLLQQAVNAGSGEAMVMLAIRLLDNDSNRASEMLYVARQNNLEGAYYQTGVALQQGKLDPADSSVKPDELAFEMFSTGHSIYFEKPCSNSTFGLINCLMDGIGVKQDTDLAMDLLLKAAEYDAEAQLVLADYISVGKGWEKNLKTASTWYKSGYEELSKMAATGNFENALECGDICEHGLPGIEKNISKAIHWWDIASKSHKPSIKRKAIEKLKQYQDEIDK